MIRFSYYKKQSVMYNRMGGAGLNNNQRLVRRLAVMEAYTGLEAAEVDF